MNETVADSLREAMEGTTDEPEPEAPPETEAPAEEAQDAPEAQPEEQQDADSAEEAEEAPPVELPHGWGKEHAESFSALPPEHQELIRQRESERNAHLTKKSQEIAERLREADALEDFFNQRQGQLSLAGQSRTQYVQQLGAMADYANSNPQQFVEWFAKQKGLNLAQQQNETEYVDPQVSQLQTQLNQLTNYINQQQQQQSQSQTATLQQQISTFATETDANGNAANPHFEAVRGTMGAMIQSGQASDLVSAYDMAVRAHPEIGPKMMNERIEAERKALQDKAMADAKKKAASAKRKAGSVFGAPTPGGAVDETADNVRDELLRLMNQ